MAVVGDFGGGVALGEIQFFRVGGIAVGMLVVDMQNAPDGVGRSGFLQRERMDRRGALLGERDIRPRVERPGDIHGLGEIVGKRGGLGIHDRLRGVEAHAAKHAVAEGFVGNGFHAAEGMGCCSAGSVPWRPMMAFCACWFWKANAFNRASIMVRKISSCW